MNPRSEILSMLADGRFHSGEELARKLSISRTAVWKRIRSLQQSGLVILSVKGKGYCITQSLEFLDQEQLFSFLDMEIRPLVRKLTIHEKTESTNQYLLDLIGQSGFHGHVTLAEYQTAGRGRRGHRWVSPYAAGISMSVGWNFDPAPEPIAIISLGTGVAVIRALHRIGVTDAGLKWPNDIIWHNRKLGGTLVEMRAESAGPCNIVIGIGINFSFPDIKGSPVIDQPWVDIAGIMDSPVSRNRFSALLISELIRFLLDAHKKNDHGIIDEWRKYDCMKGKHARLILSDRSVDGTVLGIDENGALLMSVNDRLEKFSSGEVSLRMQS